jgi:hypothetical protein
MNGVQTNQMTATAVTYSEKVQELFDELKEQNYSYEDMDDFIAEHGEDNFFNFYEEYVTFGENYSYDAVDAFIEEFGIQSLSSFEDAYMGEYSSKGDYAEQYLSDCYSVELPGFVEIDWDATFDNMDEVFVDGFVFNSQF